MMKIYLHYIAFSADLEINVKNASICIYAAFNFNITDYLRKSRIKKM